MRANLQNRSHGKTHVVTLVYPNNAYGGYGNNISRLSRTVTIAPESSQVVSLLQPPLPAQGDGSIRVEVDGRHGGEIHAPNANNHCNYYSRGGQSATVFISRNLDFDAVGREFQANHGAFTAAMAVGAPDARGYGLQPNSWVPDMRRYGQTNWLELDYATPLAADLQADVASRIAKIYGAGLDISFRQNPALIGGLRIQVGSDLYDGSVKTRLERLEQSF